MSSTRDDDIRNKRLFDIRTVERNIKKGLITRKDYEKYLKSLPDVSAQVAPPEESDVDTDSDMLDGEDDDDESATAATEDDGQGAPRPVAIHPVPAS